MQIVRISNPNGIDDLKMIAESPAERSFLRQLAEAGTLTSLSRVASSTLVFRAISIATSNSSQHLISSGNIGKLDLTVRQNQNFLINLTFSSAQVPIDLTQYSDVRLQVRLRKGGGLIIPLALGSGLAILGEANNILSVAFSAAQTELLCNDEYYYDILFLRPGTSEYKVEGKIIIQRTITR